MSGIAWPRPAISLRGRAELDPGSLGVKCAKINNLAVVFGILVTLTDQGTPKPAVG